MFYSVLEMNGEPNESLDIMRDNLLGLRTPQGVVFLNTCDDCFKIFPAPDNSALPVVVPFISSIGNVEQKARELLIGGVWCKGAYHSGYEPSGEEWKRVKTSLYYAHRLAKRDLTFLDRLFEAYERINEGSSLEQALSSLISPDLVISQERGKQTRNKIYSKKQLMEGG
ncbi:MAG: hypothetical protein HW406_1629 [Candidatus Brocadiaceae bacterium]|nr:hypothetical protein [Candidatus Brocadiaceae bacterium]